MISLWLDIVPEKQVGEKKRIWTITKEPTEEFEVRVSVLGCKGVPEADVEGTTDAFIKVFFDKNDIKETETHYRCTTGEPNFNYRVKLSRKTPIEQQSTRLTLQLWDRDLIKNNDLMCEWTIDLRQLILDSQKTNDVISLNNTYFERRLKQTHKDALKFITKPEVGNEGYVIELSTED